MTLLRGSAAIAVGATIGGVTAQASAAQPLDDDAPQVEAPLESASSDPSARPASEPAGGMEGEGLDDLEGLIDLEALGDATATESLLFADFGSVVTAARSAQSAALASTPVSVLTFEDLYYSGVDTLPDALRFVPGVDALQIDRNRWALGVRGLHQLFSDRTLLLMNGRNANDAVTGAIDFQTLPIFLFDVERVEVVRGPGGGAWGANAFNGVINVIEKSPRDTTGVFTRHRVNEFGDYRGSFRVGDAGERFAWRLSGELEENESSGSVFVATSPVPGATSADDFSRSRRFGFTGLWEPSDVAKLDFGVSYNHLERGDAPYIGLQVGSDERIDLGQAHVKFTRELSADASFYVQWYGAFRDVNRPSNFRYTSYENTLDAQIDVDVGPAHDVSFGATVRLFNIVSTLARPTDTIPSATEAEQSVGFFGRDVWKFADRWSLESQARVDWYSETEWDYSGRVALLREFGESRRHVGRLAVARAFRTPRNSLRGLEAERFPIATVGQTTFYGLNIPRPGELDNETLWSLEAGYTGRLAEGLTLEINGYLQRYEELTRIVSLPEPAPTLGRAFATLAQGEDADAVGAEAQLRYSIDDLELTAWYAYNDFDYEVSSPNARAYRPATHKVGAGARWRVFDWFTANANYRYTDTTPGDGNVPSVRPSHRLDLTATLGRLGEGAELQVGVLDALDSTDHRIFDESAPEVGSAIPGRTFFAQVQLSF
ncbi:MAG: hypothetical protein CMJ31_13840 [Phycisphaerae bacterium]|nr:hypothetical protein [Phycisphaerae bacterium]